MDDKEVRGEKMEIEDEKKKRMFFKPKIFTQEETQRNMKEMFQKNREMEQGKEFKIEGKQLQPHTPLYQPVIEKKPEEKPKEEKKTFWTAEQWEEWATIMYQTYPEAIGQFLPEWFVKKMDEQKK